MAQQSQLKRQLRGRAKSLSIFGLMVLLGLFAKLREWTGIATREDLEIFLAEDLIPTVLFLLLGLGAVALIWWGAKKALGITSSYPLSSEPSSKPVRSSSFRISKEKRRIIEYWQRSLTVGSQVDISDRELTDFGVYVGLDAISAGQIDADKIGVIARKAGDRTRDPQQMGQDPDRPIEVLLAPVVFTYARERGIDDGDLPRIVVPLWVPAIVERNGKLRPPREGQPWVPRAYLEPVVRDLGLTFGTLAAVEKFSRSNPLQFDRTWMDYWQYAEELFRAATGSRLRSFTIDGYERRSTSSVIAGRGLSGGTTAVVRMYTDILNGRTSLGLAGTFSDLTAKGRRPENRRKSVTSSAALLHSGQFDARYPLAPSQRRAVHECLLLRDNEILAVTGPPGTGKTTLIQSVVASLWVLHARLGRKFPPLILSCSATNQAMTNVIHSFSMASVGEGPLAGRWLPGVESYATFCSSQAKASQLEDILFTLVDGGGTFTAFERMSYAQEAQAHFLSCFAQAYGKAASLQRAVAHLQSELRREYAAFYREILRLRDDSMLESVTALFGTPPKKPEEQFFADLAPLDTAHRNRMFQLATHYWEGRWLQELPGFLKQLESKRRNGKLRLDDVDWRTRAMLTPCFVATFTIAPTYFGGAAARKGPPVELFIVDEASQVSPEVAGAVFALARRALVIGDAAQLEPVWSTPPFVDAENAARSGLLRHGDSKGFQVLDQAGLLASSGSVMRRAQVVSRVGSATSGGVFLAEHWRSVPEIVEFANALCYGGRLSPRRTSLEKRILPPFGYAHVRGFCSTHGTSRFNRAEAVSISEWLTRNSTRLAEYYQKPLAEIVAIVTPFSAQAQTLTRMLSSKFPGLIVGSVNSLQGAERPVVLFSPVYDRSFRGTYFFDQKPNMLNVAVTRAKDSFLVIGDMELFKPEGSAPSSLLARFLFRDPANELPDVEPAAIEEKTAEGLERVSALDRHREILINALRNARQEVIIVSPTISVHAIEYDSLPREIEEARRRGVRVRVYTDNLLDLDQATKTVRQAAKAGREVLVASGCELTVTERIHNKSLTVDDLEIVEGSFNWLSAVRKRDGAHQKHEVSYRVTGSSAASRIQELKAELAERALPAS